MSLEEFVREARRLGLTLDKGLVSALRAKAFPEECSWPFGFEAPSECAGGVGTFLASGPDGRPSHVTRLCGAHRGRWGAVLGGGVEPESFPGEASAWEVMLR